MNRFLVIVQPSDDTEEEEAQPNWLVVNTLNGKAYASCTSLLSAEAALRLLSS